MVRAGHSQRHHAGEPLSPMPTIRRRSERGQSLVEFALVLMPLFVILLGIIQFGFIFNSYVTITNAAREGARNGTIYIYDASMSKAQNDLARNNQIKTSVIASMNLLTKVAPNFATGSTWTQSGTTFTNGDLVVGYVLPSGTTESDARVGQQITVRATYHQELIIPLIAQLLPKDANGRLGLMSEVTMVAN
jgi:Flp pilus assembly protein TadG